MSSQDIDRDRGGERPITYVDPFDMTMEQLAEAAPGTLAHRVEPRRETFRSSAGEVKLSASEAREMSYESLAKLLGNAVDATESIGTDQFGIVIEDKHVLVGVPFVIVKFHFYAGDYGADFVSAWVMTLSPTGTGERYILNDGSTGICRQLRDLQEAKAVNSMLMCRHGLRVSKYTHEMPDGKEIEAETFYIDTRL